MTEKNYCTGWSNAPTNINSCCHQHDKDYGIRGTVSRAEADRRLRECMIKNGHLVKAWVFWLVVRLFGWAFYKNKEIKIEK